MAQKKHTSTGADAFKTGQADNESIRLLLVEDNPGDVRLVHEMLRGWPSIMLETSGCLADCMARLNRRGIGLVLLDLGLPDSDGIETLTSVARAFPNVPVVALTGNDDVETALKAVRAGAQDYLPKGIVTPEILQRTIRYAIKRKQSEESLRESEEKYRELVENLNEVIFTVDTGGNIRYVSTPVRRLTGYESEELTGRRFSEFIYPDDLPCLESIFSATLEGRQESCEFRYYASNGNVRWASISVHSAIGRNGVEGVRGIFSDITERHYAGEEKAMLEEQLQHSQKVDAIGRLAGGIAHDFNNMLSVILGYAEMLHAQLKDEGSLREKVDKILEAARHSAMLTRQLLAFSRRQTLQPEVLNLNTVLLNFEKMLQRLMGEDIEMKLVLSEGLGRIMADPGQIEQVLMNLSVNARDAMPQGGRLVFETLNTEFDEAGAHCHAGVKPGKYVMLVITDTGCGMDKNVLSHIFEPFFTTKEEGKGTGLGLSTVYGIIKQSNGHIRVYSEPGKGASFRIYLPVTQAEFPGEKEKSKEDEQKGCGESILVIEDVESLRTLFETIFTNLNYKVTTAQNGREALLLIEEKGLNPDIVITDVVMPGMSGFALVERLRSTHPGLKVLFMSGYTDGDILHHGALKPGTPFIQKPFKINDIAAKVREILKCDNT
ncbi:MAG: response regulator [Planctomycetes bacterium]|nr:response regulator [Planctomycetota bacterium]